MNLKDKSDAELNKMIAETTGIVPQHDMSIMSEYSGATCSKCHKAQVYILRDKSPCLPLGYCSSAEAQAQLKKWMIKEGASFDTSWDATHKVWYVGFFELPNGEYLVTDEDWEKFKAATEGRALAEAFVMAFGGDKKVNKGMGEENERDV